MSDVDAAAMVREHVRAFNTGDLDALLTGFTEDAVWITGTTVVRGRAALRDLFSQAMRSLRPTLRIESLLSDGGMVACQLTETLTVEGRERSYAIAGFYRHRAGRIESAKIYREGSDGLA